jgi:hypothetical protein
MAKSNNQENTLARLYSDWHTLLDLRLHYEPGTTQRQELDARFIKVRPLIMLVTDPNYKTAEIKGLADIALKILETKKE